MGNRPLGTNVKEGQNYFICSCSKTSRPPFCDGSHSGTGKTPIVYKATTTGTVFICDCGQTNRSPLCDGSHGRAT